MKDGVTAREVYQHALSFVKEKKPELEKHFVKTIGHGVRRLFVIMSQSYVFFPDGA